MSNSFGMRFGSRPALAIALAVLCMVIVPPARADRVIPANVGLITQVSGKVSYVANGSAARPVRAFMKARAGDELRLEAGSVLRLVYYQAGRQETWRGPAAFRVGTAGSIPIGKHTPATVARLRVSGADSVRRVPALLKRMGVTRVGKARVRAAELRVQWQPRGSLSTLQSATLRQAEERYRLLRKRATADDVAPEIVLLGTYAELGLRADILRTLRMALKRAPGHKPLTQLEAALLAPRKAAPSR